jgi:hypothetical protein
MNAKLHFTIGAWLLAVYLIAVSLVLWHREGAGVGVIAAAALVGFVAPWRSVVAALGTAIAIGTGLVVFHWASFALDGHGASVHATLGALVVGIAAWYIKLLYFELVRSDSTQKSGQTLFPS